MQAVAANFMAFTGSNQPLIEPLNCRITSDRCQGGHVKTKGMILTVLENGKLLHENILVRITMQH